MGIQAQPRKLFGRFKFNVLDLNRGLVTSAFRTASGLKFNIAKIEYWEGGSLISFKEPGRVTFDDLTLERGVFWQRDFYDWVLQVVNLIKYAPGGGGDVDDSYKRSLNVQQLDRNNKPAIGYPVKRAFPISWAPGDFDNSVDEVSVESLVLTYEYFTREEIAGAT